MDWRLKVDLPCLHCEVGFVSFILNWIHPQFIVIVFSTFRLSKQVFHSLLELVVIQTFVKVWKVRQYCSYFRMRILTSFWRNICCFIRNSHSFRIFFTRTAIVDAISETKTILENSKCYNSSKSINLTMTFFW